MHASQLDATKIVAVIKSILNKDQTEPMVFLNHADFYELCGVSSLRKAKFAEEVSDQLTRYQLANEIGVWLYTEYGDGYYVFVRVSSVSAHSEVVFTQLKKARAARVLDTSHLRKLSAKPTSPSETPLDAKVDALMEEVLQTETSVIKASNVIMTSLFKSMDRRAALSE